MMLFFFACFDQFGQIKITTDQSYFEKPALWYVKLNDVSEAS